MQSRLLMGLMIVVCLTDLAVAQNRIVVLNRPGVFPAASPRVTDTAREFVDETETLRRRLLKLMIEKTAAMSANEIHRAISQLENGNASLPPAADEILATFDDRSTAVKREANRKIKAIKKETVEDLKKVQDLLTKEGNLDQAVAVRDMIRALRTPSYRVRPNPGRLSEFGNQVGKSFHFRVTGNVGGSLWGTGIYTSDSNLATAAVHAGVLRKNQTAVVKVTILAGQNSYNGSTSASGVASSGYGQYPSSYKVEAVRLD